MADNSYEIAIKLAAERIDNLTKIREEFEKRPRVMSNTSARLGCAEILSNPQLAVIVWKGMTQDDDCILDA